MEINILFLPYWPPPDPVSIWTGLASISTLSIYSLLLGIAAIIAAFILYFPIYGLFRLWGRWRARMEDEEDTSPLANANQRIPESDDEEDEVEWVLEPRWVRRAITA